MFLNPHRRWLQFTLALAGLFLGLAVGFALARLIVIHAASRRVAEYARELSNYSLLYAAEVGNAWRTLDDHSVPPCSPQDLLNMKHILFFSVQIREIVRVVDGKVECSVFGGRFPAPVPLPAQPMLLANNGHFYADLPVPDSKVRVPLLEKNGVGLIISPGAFDLWSRPHMHYEVLLVNPAIGRIQHFMGEDYQVRPNCSLDSALPQASGTLMYANYLDRNKVCVVVSNSVSDVLADNATILQGFTAMGGLAGLSLAIILIMIFARRTGLVQQLRRAIRERRLSVVYQPVVDLTTRAIVGAEALVRWNDPANGRVNPETFIRLAEDFGVIHELTNFVVERAATEMRSLLLENRQFCLSINVTVADLARESFFSLLDRITQSTGIMPHQLALELTERSAGDLAEVQKAIQRLHELDFEIYIDDFGMGHSSLAYLLELHADAVKIDRIFIGACGTDAVIAPILPQIISMVECTGMQTIIEGVETEQQLRFLAATGRPLRMQGFLLARPMPAADLIAAMSDETCAQAS